MGQREFESGRLFKTALWGFNKDDVMIYIRGFAEQKARELTELENQNRYLVEQLHQRDEQIAALGSGTSAQNENARAPEAESDALQTENEKLKGRIAELNDEISSMRKLETEYNALKLHIADIELDIRRRAEEVHRKAEAEANLKFSRSAESAKEMMRTLAAAIKSTSEQTAMAERSLADFKAQINSISKNVEDFTGNQPKFYGLNAKADNAGQ